MNVESPDLRRDSGVASPAGARPPYRTKPFSARLWIAFVALGVAMTVVYYLLPSSGTGQAIVYVAMAALTTTAIAIGLRRNRPQARSPWVILIAGHAVYTIAAILWHSEQFFGEVPPFPGPSDPMWITAYLLIAVAVARLVTNREMYRDRTALLDSLIIAIGVGVLSFQFIIAPALALSDLTLAAHVTSAAYPVIDLIILAVLVRLTFSPGAPVASFWFLALGLAGQLLADTAYALTILQGTFFFGNYAFLGWFCELVFVGAAALHPSMTELSKPSDRGSSLRGRTTLLGVAAVIPPIVIAISQIGGGRMEVVVIAALAIVLFILVMIRMQNLTRDIARRKQLQEESTAARDEAMRASELKSEFLAMMSHEIRTPMNAVIGLTGLLLETDLDAVQRKYADGVRRAGEGLLALINDILDFSKVEAGRLDLEPVRFEPQRICDDVADLVSETARGKDIEVYSYCMPGVPHRVWGDGGRLRQILLNLMGNAVKFTDRGTVVVRVQRADSEDQGRVRLLFEVSDSGPGVDPDTADRLFEPFEQADLSSTRSHAGTGLGLAIAKRFVEMMDGEIGVRLNRPQGSTFWFTAVFDADEESTNERAGAFHAGTRVLILDGNETSREVLAQQLSAWQFDVSMYGSPDEALEALQQATSRFDLLLVDLDMPNLGGIDFTRNMRALDAYATTPVIMLTSSDGQDAIAAAHAAGATTTITKPARQSQLYDAVVAVLMPERARSAQARKASEPAVQIGGHVLLVEDNPANQLVGSSILERFGCAVDIASNAREAVEAVRRRDYDVILMDCQMPEMDGYAATRAIRRLENGDKHVPIVAMTAAALAGDRERALEAGMDDYLTKPVRKEEVGAAVARWSTARPPQPRTASNGDPTIDGERWKMLSDLAETSDDDFLTDLVTPFLEQTDDQCRRLQQAIDDDDPATVREVAHGLKGAAANLGAVRLSSLASRLENGRDGDGIDTTVVAEVRAEYERVRNTLTSRLQASR